MEDFDINFVRRCSVVVSGFDSSMSDGYKEQIMTPIYQKGGCVRWVSPMEAVAVFPSEASLKGLRVSGPAKMTVLSTMSSHLADSYDSGEECVCVYVFVDLPAVIEDLYSNARPERSVTVANRLIGAALGKKIIATASPQSKPTPPPDAWDD